MKTINNELPPLIAAHSANAANAATDVLTPKQKTLNFRSVLKRNAIVATSAKKYLELKPAHVGIKKGTVSTPARSRAT